MNTPSSVPLNHGHVDKKVSPSTFIPELKLFGIDQAKYKHYGHLMSSEQVENIMRKPEKESRSSSMLDLDVTSPLDPRPVLNGEMKEAEKPKIEKLSISEIAIRGLDFDIGKSYTEETVREIVRLRCEQERTKQSQYKLKLGEVVLELLKEAEQHGFGGDLIQKLFLDENTESYRNYIHFLKGKGNDIPVHTPLPKLPVIDDSTVIRQNAPSRCLSGTQLLSQNQATAQVKPQTSVDSGANSVTGSILGTSHLPNMPMYSLHVYPVYYTQVPEKHEEPELLGLPYQKYPAVVIQQGHQHQHQPQSQQQQQQSQVGRPYFYVNSLPPGMAPVMTSQYFIPPPMPSNMVQWTAPLQEKKDEEVHHSKRQKGNKNSINFMITTPKNPPAKKYNKL